MKIALLGYGRMGRMIEQAAIERDHQVIIKVDKEPLTEAQEDLLTTADVAIEFSTPDSVLQNIEKCMAIKLPVVVGTTGWYGHLQQVKDTCEKRNTAVMYGSNFSIGVNLFFEVNKYLARVMNAFASQYDVEIEEIHHIHKLDAPSGTAITIAEDLISQFGPKKEWVSVNADAQPVTDYTTNHLIIKSFRQSEVPGTHTVIYDSAVDRIELKHEAHGREGFALGAVLAAEWLKDKSGFFSVKDMFNFKAD